MSTPSRVEVAVRGREWLPFLIGFVLLWGTLALLSGGDAAGTWHIPILVAVLAVALVVNRVVSRTTWSDAARHPGLGRPGWRAVVLGAVVAGLVLLVFPFTVAITGRGIGVISDWPWVLVGLFAFHGIAEEVVWRAYTFRRLRVGRPFARAVLWSMPLVAASHIPIIVNAGPAVGIGAMLVAALTSIPFAYLYETGRATIWAPALVHTAIDSFKLFVVPPESAATFAVVLISMSLVVPLTALAVPRRVLQPASP